LEVYKEVSRIFRPKSFLTAVMVLILAMAIYGFAAANVVPESGAGDGSGTISGYTVSNIDYVLNAANPANIDSVSFDIAATAGAGAPDTIEVQLISGGSWFSCVDGGGGSWSCAVAGVTVLAADNLHVVAVE
jgi:hypothetical protein